MCLIADKMNDCSILAEIPEVFHMPMNHRPRVLLLIPHLGGGGAERVMALLAAASPRRSTSCIWG